jgi:hypothetical protein
MAATVACNFTGSTTLGFGGHLIKIMVGLPVGLMRRTAKRSARVTGPEANSMGDDMDTVTSEVIEVPASGASANRGRPMGRKPGLRKSTLGTRSAVFAI